MSEKMCLKKCAIASTAAFAPVKIVSIWMDGSKW